MAYQVKRAAKIYEELELIDEMNQIAHTLTISLDADTMARSLNEKYIELVKADQNLKELSKEVRNKEELDQAFERIGAAVQELYEMVFGKENAEIIFNFYENRMVEMNLEITPFIIHVIIPRVREVVQETRKRAGSKYSRSQIKESGRFKRG